MALDADNIELCGQRGRTDKIKGEKLVAGQWQAEGYGPEEAAEGGRQSAHPRPNCLDPVQAFKVDFAKER